MGTTPSIPDNYYEGNLVVISKRSREKFALEFFNNLKKKSKKLLSYLD